MVYDLTEYAHTNNVFYESIIHYGLSSAIDEVIEKYNKLVWAEAGLTPSITVSRIFAMTCF